MVDFGQFRAPEENKKDVGSRELRSKFEHELSPEPEGHREQQQKRRVEKRSRV